MHKVRVTFIQERSYEVELTDEEYEDFDEDKIIDKAYPEFKSDMYYPVAITSYDDVRIEKSEEAS